MFIEVLLSAHVLGYKGLGRRLVHSNRLLTSLMTVLREVINLEYSM